MYYLRLISNIGNKTLNTTCNRYTVRPLVENKGEKFITTFVKTNQADYEENYIVGNGDKDYAVMFVMNTEGKTIDKIVSDNINTEEDTGERFFIAAGGEFIIVDGEKRRILKVEHLRCGAKDVMAIDGDGNKLAQGCVEALSNHDVIIEDTEVPFIQGSLVIFSVPYSEEKEPNEYFHRRNAYKC